MRQTNRMANDPEKLNVSPRTLLSKISLEYKARIEHVKLIEEASPDYSLTLLEVIYYRIMPWALALGSVLAKETAIGRITLALLNRKTEMEMDPKKINIITNIIGIALAILEPVRSYLTTQPFDYGTFAVCLLGAIVAYFTGKSGLAALRGVGG